MKIAVLIDQYKYKFSVNLTDGGVVCAKRNFKNPVLALDYVGKLQAMGHIENGEQVAKLVELAEIWRANS